MINLRVLDLTKTKKSASVVMLKTLSGCPNLPISDVRWTPLSGCYKLNLDTISPIEGVSGVPVLW